MMGAALAKGMVMVLSIWDDSAANMNWPGACTVAGPVYWHFSRGSDFVFLCAVQPDFFGFGV